MSSSESPLQKSRILLIDDDAISREILGMMLEAHGIEVDLAEDGPQALAMLRSSSDEDFPSLILMDTQMPGLSGVELIVALRKSCSSSGDTPIKTRILAISASPVDDQIYQAADGFLQKPIDVDRVRALLQTQPAKFDSDLGSNNLNAKQASIRIESESPSELTIDPIVLGKYRAMMPDAAVREIYAAVASDLHPRLAQLKEAMDEGNTPQVKRIAHAIKGSCGMFGLKSAAEAAARLETEATSNVPDTYSAELARLYAALQALEVILGGDFPIG